MSKENNENFFSLTVRVCIDLNFLQQETSQELILFKLTSIQNIDAGSSQIVLSHLSLVCTRIICTAACLLPRCKVSPKIKTKIENEENLH